jgi:hypothetical protein
MRSKHENEWLKLSLNICRAEYDERVRILHDLVNGIDVKAALILEFLDFVQQRHACKSQMKMIGLRAVTVVFAEHKQLIWVDIVVILKVSCIAPNRRLKAF